MIHKKKKSLIDHFVDSAPSHHANAHRKGIHAHSTPVHAHQKVLHKKVHTTSASHLGHTIHRPRQLLGSKLFSETSKKKIGVPRGEVLHQTVEVNSEPEKISSLVQEAQTPSHRLNIPTLGRTRSTITTLEDIHRMVESKESPVKVLEPQSAVRLRDAQPQEELAAMVSIAPESTASVVEIDTLSIPTAQKFHLGFGRMLSNIRELLEYLKEISDEEWQRFVTPEENYFALWIERIFGEKELASKLHGSNRLDSIEILDSYLKGN